MPTSTIPSPKSGQMLVDEYFLENRTRVLEVAAFLDRLDRSDDPPNSDFRIRALRETLQVLSSGSYPRVEKIQMILSDPTSDPLEQLHSKSARGAYPGDGGK